MSRYHLKRVGVHDRDNARDVTPESPFWAEYREFVRAGGVVDPEPFVAPEPPSPEEVAALAELAAREVMVADLKADSTIQFLRTHTPAECSDWVNANVTDLASAKQVLSKMAMVVAYLARERLNRGT